MFKNHLKTALRFLKRNKLFAGINILPVFRVKSGAKFYVSYCQLHTDLKVMYLGVPHDFS